MAVDPNRFAGPAEAVILRDHIENETSDLLRVRSRLQKARTALSDAELALRAAQEAADSARAVVAQGEAHETALTDSIDHARGLLHPVRRVPDEILAEIFLQWLDGHSAAPPDPSMWNYRPLQLVPFTAARICKRWRAVALNTPLLWTLIVVDFHKVEQKPASWYFFSDVFCVRSKSSRLSLWVTVFNDIQDDIYINSIWNKLSMALWRCGFLSVQCGNLQHSRLENLIRGNAPLLDGFVVINNDWDLEEDLPPLSIFENLPRLRDLRLEDVEISWDEGRPFNKTKKLYLSRAGEGQLSLQELAQIAAKLPNLEELCLRCSGTAPSISPEIRFSRVQRLELTGDISLSAAQYLRFPLLQEVLLVRPREPPAIIIGMALSHSTNLSKLTLDGAVAEATLAEGITSLNSLVELTLTKCVIFDDFFRRLAAQGPSGSIPFPLLVQLHLTDVLPTNRNRSVFDGTTLLAFIRGRRASATTSSSVTALRDVKVAWAKDSDRSFEGFQDELQRLMM